MNEDKNPPFSIILFLIILKMMIWVCVFYSRQQRRRRLLENNRGIIIIPGDVVRARAANTRVSDCLRQLYLCLLLQYIADDAPMVWKIKKCRAVLKTLHFWSHMSISVVDLLVLNSLLLSQVILVLSSDWQFETGLTVVVWFIFLACLFSKKTMGHCETSGVTVVVWLTNKMVLTFLCVNVLYLRTDCYFGCSHCTNVPLQTLVKLSRIVTQHHLEDVCITSSLIKAVCYSCYRSLSDFCVSCNRLSCKRTHGRSSIGFYLQK